MGWSSRFSRSRTNQSDESDEVDILNVDSDDDEPVDIETVKLGDMGLVTQLRCKTVEYSAALHGITDIRRKHCDVEKHRRRSLVSLFNDLQKAVSSTKSSNKLPKVKIFLFFTVRTRKICCCFYSGCPLFGMSILLPGTGNFRNNLGWGGEEVHGIKICNSFEF